MNSNFNINKRNLFCLGTALNSNPFLSETTSVDWDFYVATDIKKARELQDQYSFSVGVVYFENEKFDQLIRNWEDIYSINHSCEWIALMPYSYLQNDYLRHLIKTRFFDFHTLPIDMPRFLVTLGHAYGKANLSYTSDSKKTTGKNDYEIIGQSVAAQILRKNIKKLSCIDAPVLIEGESGSGKEFAARAIHANSNRYGNRFVTVNCRSTPSNLIQSELLGHKKDVGAKQKKIERIEAAAGCTLFLDEIEYLPFELQNNLLQFLQKKTIDRVDDIQSIPVDIRIIASTHVDLEKAVTEERFQQDLYYQLNVFHLNVPPLCERKEDIDLLANFFFEDLVKEKESHIKGISQQALDAMHQYHWPGNVREMINRIRQAMMMSENRLITSADLGLNKRRLLKTVTPLYQAREVAEKEAIRIALQYTHQNISQAASKLEISRMTLHRLLQKHGIQINTSY